MRQLRLRRGYGMQGRWALLCSSANPLPPLQLQYSMSGMEGRSSSEQKKQGPSPTTVRVQVRSVTSPQYEPNCACERFCDLVNLLSLGWGPGAGENRLDNPLFTPTLYGMCASAII